MASIFRRHGDDMDGMSEEDEMSEMLEAILDDTELQVVGNAYARYFWYGIVVVIGIASLFRLARWLTLKMRLREAARGKDQAAMPSNALMVMLATVTAVGREASYLQFTPTSRFRSLRVPPLGTNLLLLAYLAFVLALEFNDNDVKGEQHWQALGVRAGWLAVAQMPLLILLIGKNNLIGLVTGVSYERLNVLHRWSARIMLLLAIMHFGYQSYGWQNYGLMTLEWATDDCPNTGIAAFAILLWMNLSTIAPFRNWPSYEFFVIQHIVTFIGFIVAIMYHLPSTALYSRVYIWIPIGLYLADRLLRTLWYVWVNLHYSRATLTALDGGVTKIRVGNKAIQNWRPGSHVLVSIPRFGYWQNHPATIASTPKSHNGDMVFMLKSHKGFTRKIMTHANDSATALLPHTKQETQTQQNARVETYVALLDGPYGGSQSDFAAFDSVCLIAGSTGLTFTLAILQDIAGRAESSGKKLPVRRVHFVWCVKNSSWARWANDDIATAVGKLQTAGIEVKVDIYVTCADSFTEQSNDPKECPCACDKSLGPCCCVVVDEDDEGVPANADAIAPVEKSALGPTGKGTAITARPLASTNASSSTLDSANEALATRLPILPCASFFSGRPEIENTLVNILDGAQGESGVAVCGPIGLSKQVRNCVVKLSDQRAIHKGTGAQGLYLHVESFS